jgi:hypothetical protein
MIGRRWPTGIKVFVQTSYHEVVDLLTRHDPIMVTVRFPRQTLQQEVAELARAV